MRTSPYRGALIALNVVLLAALALVSLSGRADAQNSGQPRARGEYTLLSGRSNGGGASIVYVIDANNQEIVALRWDQSSKVMSGVGYRSVAGDAKVNPGR